MSASSIAPLRRATRSSLPGPGPGLLAIATLVLACLVPGRLEPVAPEISGRVVSSSALPEEARLVLVVRHRENPTLFARRGEAPGRDGIFAFPPLDLDRAGREYSKVYRVLLRLEQPTGDRVIWRTLLARRLAGRAIELDCVLDRPPAQGQPCQVRDPLSHDWLLAEGQRTYWRLCADCHPLPGAPAVAWDRSTPPPPDLARIAARRGGRFDRAEIAEWIEGRDTPRAHLESGMPVWGERLSDEYRRYAEGDELIGATLDPLLAYLEWLQAGPGAPTSDGGDAPAAASKPD